MSASTIGSEEATCEQISDVDDVANNVARNTAGYIVYFLFIPATIVVLTANMQRPSEASLEEL
jgi:hypothetical protein